ncbi:MAG: trypsin-like serine protease, partial [Pseudomonas sp.]|uniref:trypsin-like serine protease n=1 Tax=Pseudomonas sp. TaxID=306 RepID=UPI0030EFF758
MNIFKLMALIKYSPLNHTTYKTYQHTATNSPNEIRHQPPKLRQKPITPRPNFTQTSASDWRRKVRDHLIAITIAAASILAAATPAHALTKATNSAKPWVIRALSYANGDLGGACSGAAINELMVITAAHCKADVIMYEDIDHFMVVNARYPIDGTDIQVLVLRDSHPISEYPTLGRDRLAIPNGAIPPGTIGTVYGYGSADDLPQKQLSVRIDGHGATPTKKEYLQAIAPNGAETELGDSGGPLIIDNQLVGILSGTRIHPKDGHKYEIFSGISPVLSTIRRLEHAREMRSVATQDNNLLPWVSAVKVENQAVLMTLSDELINSDRQIVVWVNGRYLGEVHGKHSYYAYGQKISNGVIYRMEGFAVRDTDII